MAWGQRRLQREWQAYRAAAQPKPVVRFGSLFGRRPPHGDGRQFFRSLVQVNFYPRPRDQTGAHRWS
jgi:hypothetical protein